MKISDIFSVAWQCLCIGVIAYSAQDHWWRVLSASLIGLYVGAAIKFSYMSRHFKLYQESSEKLIERLKKSRESNS